jgi:hypothetical protein
MTNAAFMARSDFLDGLNAGGDSVQSAQPDIAWPHLMARRHNQMRQRRRQRSRPSDSFKLADDWVRPSGNKCELQLAG